MHCISLRQMISDFIVESIKDIFCTDVKRVLIMKSGNRLKVVAIYMHIFELGGNHKYGKWKWRGSMKTPNTQSFKYEITQSGFLNGLIRYNFSPSGPV